MQPTFLPLQLLLLTFAGWVNRRQALMIDYLREENRILKEQLGGKRPHYTDDQRRRLAAKGKLLGRKLLAQVATIVTPDTILGWYRRLIATRWTYQKRRVGRPGLMRHLKDLIVRMATDNPSWGYCRIQGAMKNLGHQVAKSTIANALNPDFPDGLARLCNRGIWTCYTILRACMEEMLGLFCTFRGASNSGNTVQSLSRLRAS